MLSARAPDEYGKIARGWVTSSSLKTGRLLLRDRCSSEFRSSGFPVSPSGQDAGPKNGRPGRAALKPEDGRENQGACLHRCPPASRISCPIAEERLVFLPIGQPPTHSGLIDQWPNLRSRSFCFLGFESGRV
jgi:hypothetical protein